MILILQCEYGLLGIVSEGEDYEQSLTSRGVCANGFTASSSIII
jgi:hypothetical protein